MNQHSLTGEERILVIVQGLFYFISSLASVFLSIYIFKLGGFVDVARFYFLSFLALLLAYNTSGFILSKKSSKDLIVSGLVTVTIFWTLLFFLKVRSIDYLNPLALILGTGQGLFWSGFNISQYVATHDTSRIHYLSKSNAVNYFGRSIAPMLGGAIVSISLIRYMDVIDGYSLLFLIVCVLFALTSFIAMRLPAHTGVTFSLRHLIKHKRSYTWKMVLVQQFILGLFDTSFTTFAGILLFIIFSGEFKVGVYNSIIALGLGLTSVLAPRILKKWQISPFPAGIVSGLSILLFAYMINIWGAILLCVLSWIATPFRDIPLMRAVLIGIDTNPDPWQVKYHMFLERDSVLGVARVLSYAILYAAFAVWGKTEVAVQWLKAVAILPVILGILIVLPNKESGWRK